MSDGSIRRRNLSPSSRRGRDRILNGHRRARKLSTRFSIPAQSQLNGFHPAGPRALTPLVTHIYMGAYSNILQGSAKRVESPTIGTDFTGVGPKQRPLSALGKARATPMARAQSHGNASRLEWTSNKASSIAVVANLPKFDVENEKRATWQSAYLHEDSGMPGRKALITRVTEELGRIFVVVCYQVTSSPLPFLL